MEPFTIIIILLIAAIVFVVIAPRRKSSRRSADDGGSSWFPFWDSGGSDSVRTNEASIAGEADAKARP